MRINKTTYLQGRVSPFCWDIHSDDNDVSDDMEDTFSDDDDDEADVCSNKQSEVTAEAAVSIQEVSPDELVLDLTKPYGNDDDVFNTWSDEEEDAGYLVKKKPSFTFDMDAVQHVDTEGILLEANLEGKPIFAKMMVASDSEVMTKARLLCQPGFGGLIDHVTLNPPARTMEKEIRLYRYVDAQYQLLEVSEYINGSCPLVPASPHLTTPPAAQTVTVQGLLEVAGCLQGVHKFNLLVMDLKPSTIYRTCKGQLRLACVDRFQPCTQGSCDHVPLNWGYITEQYCDCNNAQSEG